MKNKKAEFEGIKFDSTMEANYYKYLLTIPYIDIQLQPKFVLIPKFKYKTENRRELAYIADFKITYPGGVEIVIDIKGNPTEGALIKRKLFEFQNPHKTLVWITESKKYGEDGWISYDELKKIRSSNKKDKLHKPEP
jgi:hypothetical protein